MTSLRLQRLEALVKEMSVQEDPDRLIRAFNRHSDMIIHRDAWVSVSRRDLETPWYRITRSWLWKEVINPWTEAHRLPLLDRGLLGELLYAGKPVVINRLEVAGDDPGREHLASMHSLACAPGYDQGKPVNLAVLLRRGPDSFAAEDLESLLLNANLLGRAVHNLVLTQQLQEANRALDREKEQVGRMQRQLLPAELPRIHGLELGVSYQTCSRAGGDYYDVLPLPEDQWGLFMADVSGHGTPAAVVMAMIHTLLHAFPGPPLPPVHVLAHINRHLLAVAPEGMFATAFYGIFDPHDRRLVYASAGHPAPLLRKSTGGIRVVEVATGLPLGVAEEESWKEREVVLAPGDTLLLYTDGILEGTNGLGEPFGRRRLDDTLGLGPSRAGPLVQHLERHYKAFCNGAPDMDDRTLLVGVAVP
jgi:sigma-B regulation protein RsbU (phosphoserine phosphatase)